MRTAFINTLMNLAEKDPDIFLLTGDLGFSVLEKFRDAFPKRFINAGVAEANMVSMAAGLALSGAKPFCYSIVPFMTMRCFEQIRNDLCQQELNVKIVGVGGGLSYGPLGMTHHALSDVAVMRSLPGMTVISPGDPLEAEAAVHALYRHKGPVYLRLGKGKEPAVHSKTPAAKIGKAITIKTGGHVALLATGGMLGAAFEAAAGLEKKGIKVTLASFPTVKPLDGSFLKTLAQKTKFIFTLEEHSRIGGFGSAVGEVLLEAGFRGTLRMIALPDRDVREVGSRDYLHAKYKLTPKAITAFVLKTVKA